MTIIYLFLRVPKTTKYIVSQFLQTCLHSGAVRMGQVSIKKMFPCHDSILPSRHINMNKSEYGDVVRLRIVRFTKTDVLPKREQE